MSSTPLIGMEWPSTSVCLTKSLDPADLVLLQEDLDCVDSFPIGHEQHPMRRWEYAMCIRAIRAWDACRNFPMLVKVLDVGGAGSSLPDVIKSHLRFQTHVIDPRNGTGLLSELNEAPAYIPRSAGAVISISTIEHVPEEDLAKFITDLAAVVKPGGLLFLTTDIMEEPKLGAIGVDKKHFHWMRERIYTLSSWRLLGHTFIDAGFRYFGPTDWTYYGDHVYDYSFASMALVKGRKAW